MVYNHSAHYLLTPDINRVFSYTQPLLTGSFSPLFLGQFWGNPKDGRASVKIPVDQPLVNHASPSGTNNRVHHLQSHLDRRSDAGFERQQVVFATDELLPCGWLIRNLC